MNRFRKFSGESWKIGVDLISACKCRTTASPSITDGFVSSFMFAFGTMLAPSSSNQILLFRRFRRLCAYAPQGFRRISFINITENPRKTTGKRLENDWKKSWTSEAPKLVLESLEHLERPFTLETLFQCFQDRVPKNVAQQQIQNGTSNSTHNTLPSFHV